VGVGVCGEVCPVLLFSNIWRILYIIQTLKEICMQKNTGKKQVSSKPKKLSKCAKWWQKHPEGIGLKILDMRAVLR
jgi:hypothetical protein